MKFKADCWFLLGNALASNCMAALCLVFGGLKPYNFVAFILTGSFHRRKMSAHALEKMTRDRFRVVSLASRRKCPRNVVQMKEAMAAFFCHCKRSKIILVNFLMAVCSLENIAS